MRNESLFSIIEKSLQYQREAIHYHMKNGSFSLPHGKSHKEAIHNYNIHLTVFNTL